MNRVFKSAFEKRATEMGTYWVSSWSQARLLNRLRTKQADLGGSEESGFEQSFASLAYSYIKDKAPRLLDFLVGFQLVERNEDDTKAMGVFGFKVGDMWLYVPVFFLGGDLKGHELLYIKNKDLFVPLKENWVNHVISKRPYTLGEPTDRDSFQRGGMLPSLARLIRPLSPLKTGADREPPVLASWVLPFLPIVAAMASDPGRVLDKCAGAAEALDLRRCLTTLPLLKAAYFTMYQAYPLIKQGFDRFYGPDFFVKQAEALRDMSVLKQGEHFVLPPLRTVKKRRPVDPKAPWSAVNPPKEEEEPKVKKAAVRVYRFDGQLPQRPINPLLKHAENKVDDDTTITTNLPDLDEGEREKLLKDTVLIKDERDPHAVSMAYNTQVRMELFNPGETGLYEVLEKPGTLTRMLVIVGPKSGGGRRDFATVVRIADGKGWLNAHRSRVWSKPCDCPQRSALREFVDGLSGVDSLETGGTYLAINRDGDATCPFRVRDKHDDDVYSVSWQDDTSWEYGKADSATMRQLVDGKNEDTHGGSCCYGGPDGYDSYDALLRINKKAGASLRTVRGQTFLPGDYKIFKLKSPPSPKDDEPSFVSGASSESKPIEPGSLADVQLMLFEKLARLQVHDDGHGRVRIEAKQAAYELSPRDALVNLVWGHGFREEQARAMLKEAQAQGVHRLAAKFFVKYADPYPLQQSSPSAPAFPAEWRGTEPIGYGSVPSIYPQEEYQELPQLSAANTDPSIYDPFYKPDGQTSQVAQQAADSGQKDLFDVGVMQGMLKAVRPGPMIDRFAGDLTRALDRLCRIFFMLCWHQEDFEDHYGKQDMPELEDGVRNTIDSLGDTLLFIKKKTIQGGLDMYTGGAGVGNPSEPSIEEVARN